MTSQPSPASTNDAPPLPWEPEVPTEMARLLPDQRMTRRLRLHVAFDGIGSEGYYTADLAEALTWLHEQGVSEFIVTHDDVTYRLKLTREPD